VYAPSEVYVSLGFAVEAPRSGNGELELQTSIAVAYGDAKMRMRELSKQEVRGAKAKVACVHSNGEG
jgi:hypothetical protein